MSSLWPDHTPVVFVINHDDGRTPFVNTLSNPHVGTTICDARLMTIPLNNIGLDSLVGQPALGASYLR